MGAPQFDSGSLQTLVTVLLCGGIVGLFYMIFTHTDASSKDDASTSKN